MSGEIGTRMFRRYARDVRNPDGQAALNDKEHLTTAIQVDILAAF